MPPSSEWRCVALFFNNTAPTHAAATVSCGGAGAGYAQGVPVPASVNSLAWSTLEERLFTADTSGFVKARTTCGYLPLFFALQAGLTITPSRRYSSVCCLLS